MSIEEFFDMMDTLRCIYYENTRLREENKKLKEESDARHKQIMNMARMSEEGLHNWINVILSGDIKLK